VPLLVHSTQETAVEIAGWSFRVKGLAQIHPPHLPAILLAPSGGELARVTAPPADRFLVGLFGDGPPDLAERLDAIVVPVEPGIRLRGGDWRALDLFDRIVVTDVERAPMEELLAWCRAGGSLVVAGARGFAPGPCLGTLVQAPDLEEALRRAGPVARSRIPRPLAVWPAVYGLVRSPDGNPRALATARWIALGCAVAMAFQVLMGALGWIGRRALLRGLVLVAFAGGGLGLLVPSAHYTALAAGRIEVCYFGDGVVRRRILHVRIGVGPGATFSPGELQAPVLYRSGGDPWWRGPGRVCTLPEGVIRIFLEEQVARGRPASTLMLDSSAPPSGRMLHDRPVLDLLPTASPGGPWRAGASVGTAAPVPGTEEEPLLARLEVALQD